MAPLSRFSRLRRKRFESSVPAWEQVGFDEVGEAGDFLIQHPHAAIQSWSSVSTVVGGAAFVDDPLHGGAGEFGDAAGSVRTVQAAEVSYSSLDSRRLIMRLLRLRTDITGVCSFQLQS